MNVDKKIREVVRSSRPVVRDNGVFMQELRRQIDLLPEPAAMSKSEDMSGIERLVHLKKICSVIRRRKRKYLREGNVGGVDEKTLHLADDLIFFV